MKRICTSVLLVAMVAILCLSVLASCGTTEAEYKFGFGVETTEQGQVAAVVVIDSDNKIVAVKIDEVDVSKGKTDSKKAQGDSYGMYNNPYGSTLAEWDDQVAHLELFLEGKTLDEVEGVTGEETDLTAGCTIGVDSYIAAVAAAVENAQSNTAFKTAETISLSLTYNVTAGETEYSSTASAKAVAGEATVGEDTSSVTFTK